MSIRISPGADDMVLDERTLRDDYTANTFEQVIADTALTYLKQHGDDITLTEVNPWMDEFAQHAAFAVTYEVDEPCSRCGEMYPRRAMSNVHSDTNQPPRRVCVTCLWGEASN